MLTLVEVKEPIRSVKRTFSNPYIEQQYNAYLEKRVWDALSGRYFGIAPIIGTGLIISNNYENSQQ